MKIAILSRNPTLYSIQSLVDAVSKRGHVVQVIDAMHCALEISDNTNIDSINSNNINCNGKRLAITYHGEPLPDFDAVIPRIGGSISSYTLSVLRHFELMGVFCLNNSTAITLARDKLHTLQALSAHGITVPHTAYAHHASRFSEVINTVGGAPMIIKPIKGTKGSGVILAENNKTANTMLEAFRELRGHFLVQKYVEEANGADIRCFVVGGKVIASIKRQGMEGEFRSNLHLGATASTIQLSAQERQTAIKVAKIMGLNVCGVDILQSYNGPTVMEVNATPGLEGIETTTGIDVSGKIIEFIERSFN